MTGTNAPCAHRCIGHDEWGTIHCTDCHRTLRRWWAERIRRPQDDRWAWVWHWPFAVRDCCRKCRWVYYPEDPEDNAHRHQREVVR